MIKNYAAKPSNVDALQFNGSNFDEFLSWCPLTAYNAAKQQLTFAGIPVTINSWISQNKGGMWNMLDDQQFKGLFNVPGP